MALENFNCPQFVDFLNNDAFNIHDGADFCFEKGVVGELGFVDLGFGDPERRDSGEMERLIAGLQDATNLGSAKQKSEAVDPATLCSPKMPGSVKAEPVIDVSEDKENISRTPTKPIEIVASISSIEKCSAIQIATAALKIQTASGESTTIATAVTSVKAETVHHETKPMPLQRIRTNSNASSNDKAKPVKQSSASGGLVKKTLAKVQAAFGSKSSKPVLSTAPVDHQSLKSKLTSKKTANAPSGYTRHDGPLKVDYEKPATVRNLSPTNQSSATNRRCSSVPRTLREKQALVRSGAIESEMLEQVEPPTATTTLGEKIQNFFSSSHSHNLNMLGLSGPSKNRQNSIKAKTNPIKATKAFNSSITNSHESKSLKVNQPDRRRSRSCNESIASKLKAQKSRTESGNSASSHENGGHSSRMNTGRTIQSSPSVLNKSKPRQRSADRTPMLPLYQGVKFIPKAGPKFPVTKTDALLMNKHQITEDVLKSRPNFMSKKEPLVLNPVAKSTNAGIQVVAKLNSSSNSSSTVLTRGTTKSSSFKTANIAAKPVPKKAPQTSTTDSAAHNASGLNSTVGTNSTALDHGSSILGQRNLNESASSVKTTGTNTSARAGNLTGFLRTEVRAQMRHEFEMALKEKERAQAIAKRELDADKLRKQQEEIQRIRMQNTFRSRPIMHYKQVQIKPSEKPLTEPKSPQLGLPVLKRSRSNMRIEPNLMAKQSSGSNIVPPPSLGCDVSVLSVNANALLDAPLSSLAKMISSSSLDFSRNETSKIGASYEH